MNTQRMWFLILCFVATLSACESMAPAAGGAANADNAIDKNLGVLLVYSEREQGGGELFTSRTFVNAGYIYMNDDRIPDDYLLFDRGKQTIYSVTHGNRTIFVIKPWEIKGKPPIEINYEAQSQASSAIPKVSGRTATHYRYNVNGEHCYDAVTLEETFLPDVVKALQEYRQVLAGEHARTVHTMPPETQDACDLALNIYYAGKHLETGLPLREWDQRGFLRFMLDYRVDFKFDEEKLKLPADYKEYSAGQ
ncbi:MAG TPA: hypothetical protein VIM41_06285 [Gammaproteobacteria bacterium]